MKRYQPTTHSRRHMTQAEYPKAPQGAAKSLKRPMKSLMLALKSYAGRNSAGRITVRHRGGGVKKIYRSLDFKQTKMNVPAVIERLEYDPYRTGFIARILYKDGERSYILAPQGIKAGTEIVSSPDAPLSPGNRTELKRIPIGSMIYNIELTAKRGGQLVRSAGSCAQLLSNENGFTKIKMPSGEIRLIDWSNYASIGQVSNPENNLIVIGKAGRSRLKGWRPTVRGKVMNPRDHPYGGGEGKTTRGTRRPKTKWGKVTGGRKTRRKHKWSGRMIVQRRK